MILVATTAAAGSLFGAWTCLRLPNISDLARAWGIVLLVLAGGFLLIVLVGGLAVLGCVRETRREHRVGPVEAIAIHASHALHRPANPELIVLVAEREGVVFNPGDLAGLTLRERAIVRRLPLNHLTLSVEFTGDPVELQPMPRTLADRAGPPEFATGDRIWLPDPWRGYDG